MNSNRRKKVSYLTPAEIVDKYPELELNFNWDSRTIGLFLRAKLLQGKYNANERKSLIREDSVFKLVEHTNALIEAQKIKVEDLDREGL